MHLLPQSNKSTDIKYFIYVFESKSIVQKGLAECYNIINFYWNTFQGLFSIILYQIDKYHFSSVYEPLLEQFRFKIYPRERENHTILFS